jgi:AcrR family transcriptional regulator
MSGNTDDRRVERTKADLRHALFTLIATGDWETITVTRLCTTARVARSTFYMHYASPTAVLDEMIAAIVNGFAAADRSALPVLGWLVDHIAENRAVFQRTVAAAQSNYIIERFKAGVMKAFANEQSLGASRISTIRSAMVIGGAFAAIELWAKRWNMNEVPLLKEEIRALEHLVIGRD